jgi:hypothetical protein
MAGKIKIVGAHAIDSQALIERLTKPYLSTQASVAGKAGAETAGRQIANLEDPVWEVGCPVKFPPKGPEGGADDDDRYQEFRDAHTNPRNQLERDVANALDDQGYFLSRFAVDVVPNAKQKTAVLCVSIQKEGPHAAIGRVEISGNVKNSSEHMTAFRPPATLRNAAEAACVRPILCRRHPAAR